MGNGVSGVAGSAGQKITIKVGDDVTPRGLISEAIMRRSRKLSQTNLNLNLTPNSDQSLTGCATDYLLKVAGCQLYLMYEVPLYQYRVGELLSVLKNQCCPEQQVQKYRVWYVYIFDDYERIARFGSCTGHSCGIQCNSSESVASLFFAQKLTETLCFSIF